MAEGPQLIELTSWQGPWDVEDRDANFKTDVALFALLDPMTTVRQLSVSMDIPEGALVRYVLAKWASQGSGGLLELGPTMIHRLWSAIEQAEAVGTDDARLKAYEQLSQMIAWLRLP